MDLPPPSERCNVAIVGGGRWARVVAAILLDIRSVGSKIVLCSPSRTAGWSDWIEARTISERATLEQADTVDDVLANPSIGTVFIIRSAHDHAETAIASLTAGKDTFIEKPLAMTLNDAMRVAAAVTKQRCSVGHVLLFAPNLRRFSSAVHRLGQPHKIAILWSDPSGEHRHGEVKRYDHSVNITDDVFPHIWSLVKMFAPSPTIELNEVRLEHGGRIAAMQMMAGVTQIEVKIEREAQLRQRRISILTGEEGSDIDFSIEPGTANILGQPVDIATGYTSPLRLELESFLRISPDAFASDLCHISRAIEPILLLEPFRGQIETQRIWAIRQGAVADASLEDQDAALYALREKIAGDMRRNRRPSGPVDVAQHNEIARNVLHWCREFDTALEPPLDSCEFPWLADLKHMG